MIQYYDCGNSDRARLYPDKDGRDVEIVVRAADPQIMGS